MINFDVWKISFLHGRKGGVLRRKRVDFKKAVSDSKRKIHAVELQE
jgi:hypothetical protein